MFRVVMIYLAILLKALIGHGANIEAQDHRQWTSLLFASIQGHSSVVEVMPHLELSFR